MSGEKSAPVRDRTKKRRALKARRVLIVLLLAAAAALLAVNRDRLSPVSMLQKARAARSEQGEVREFPLDLAQENVAGFCEMRDGVFLAADSGCYVIRPKKAVFYKYSLNSPASAAGARSAAVFEQDGSEYIIHSRDGRVCSGSCENPIRNMAVAKKGGRAVLSAPTPYSSYLQIFDAAGSELFSQALSTCAVSCLALSADSSLCAVCEPAVRDGLLVSDVTVYSISEELPAARMTLPGLLALQLRFDSDGRLCALCDRALVYYSPKFEEICRCGYGGLVSYWLDSECRAALIAGGNGRGEDRVLMTADASGESRRLPVSSRACGVCRRGGRVLYIDGPRLVLLSDSCEKLGEAECSPDTRMAALGENFAAAAGKSRCVRLPLSDFS